MNPKDTMQNEARHKRTRIVLFHFYEESRIVKFIGKESKIVVIWGYEEAEMGRYFLTSTEFQFGIMRKLWKL